MSSSNPTVAFFGATGGSTLQAVILTLKASRYCRALARTPTKLVNLLLAADIKQETIDKYLFIQAGDIRDRTAVRAVLETSKNEVVPLIVSGLGMVFSFSGPSIDKTICADGTESIINTLKEIQPVQKPVMCVISTTGIDKNERDVPLLFLPFYHYALSIPHVDKQKMEDMIEAETNGGVFSSKVIVKASLLTSGAELGESAIRVSSKGDGGKVAIGYTISRKDVGSWIFRNVIDGTKWNGKVVIVTY